MTEYALAKDYLRVLTQNYPFRDRFAITIGLIRVHSTLLKDTKDERDLRTKILLVVFVALVFFVLCRCKHEYALSFHVRREVLRELCKYFAERPAQKFLVMLRKLAR